MAILIKMIGKSVQDAFAVAAYKAIMATVTIGFVQTLLG